MAEPKPMQKLLASEMSRREFLGFLGASLLAIVGVSSIVRGLSRLVNKQVDAGYGSGAYGGRTDHSL